MVSDGTQPLLRLRSTKRIDVVWMQKWTIPSLRRRSDTVRMGSLNFLAAATISDTSSRMRCQSCLGPCVIRKQTFQLELRILTSLLAPLRRIPSLQIASNAPSSKDILVFADSPFESQGIVSFVSLVQPFDRCGKWWWFRTRYHNLASCPGLELEFSCEHSGKR
jgi:hypothetical protein